MQKIRGGLILLVALLLTACEGSQTVLTISGSGDAQPLLEAVAATFEADTPGYDLAFLPSSGTGGGVEGVIQGMLDVAAMARPPTNAEAAQNVVFVQFGQVAVSLFIHPDLGITNLTTAQAIAILAGTITNWSDVGGPDQTIILYVREEGDSSTQALRDAYFGQTAFAATAQVLTSAAAMLSAVAGTPGSVGFGVWPIALATGANVHAPHLDGIAPNEAAFPVTGVVGIGFLADRQADVQPLIDWLLSNAGRAALQAFDVITE